MRCRREQQEQRSTVSGASPHRALGAPGRLGAVCRLFIDSARQKNGACGTCKPPQPRGVPPIRPFMRLPYGPEAATGCGRRQKRTQPDGRACRAGQGCRRLPSTRRSPAGAVPAVLRQRITAKPGQASQPHCAALYEPPKLDAKAVHGAAAVRGPRAPAETRLKWTGAGLAQRERTQRSTAARIVQ